MSVSLSPTTIPVLLSACPQVSRNCCFIHSFCSLSLRLESQYLLLLGQHWKELYLFYTSVPPVMLARGLAHCRWETQTTFISPRGRLEHSAESMIFPEIVKRSLNFLPSPWPVPLFQLLPWKPDEVKQPAIGDHCEVHQN